MDWKAISDKVIVGVIGGALLGILALLGNWASHGGLITLLGGVSRDELNARIAQIPPPANLDPAAVIAFNVEGCPAGWDIYKPATGRTIVGWGESFETGMRLDDLGADIRAQKFRGHGGASSVTLRERNFPEHQHDTMVKTDTTHAVWGVGEIKDNMMPGGGGYGVGEPSKTSTYGQKNPEPIQILSPFVALSYCIRKTP